MKISSRGADALALRKVDRISMAEAFLLGAGFSKQISSRMPLLKALGEEVLVNPDFRHIVRRTPHSRPESFEEWISFLSQDQPWLSEAANLENRAAFLRITEQIREIVSDSQDETLRSACPPWLKQLVATWHDQQVVVVTMNYDTLVEAAYTDTIEVMVGQYNYASHSQLYPIPLTRLAARRGGPLASPIVPTFTLLKLHGSLNWLYSGRPGFYGETIYDAGASRGWSPYIPESDLATYDTREKVPLIVPPTAGKSGFFENETVRAQWTLAALSLSRSDSIYIIGYSLPPSDLLMRSLLEQACEGKQVLPVNTDLESIEHFRRMLPGSRVLADYVASNAIERFVSEFCVDPTPARTVVVDQ